LNRYNGTLYLGVNGVMTSSAISNNTSLNLESERTTYNIGQWNQNQGGPAWGFTGYMSDFKIVKGTATYTSNFVPPATPAIANTNTTFLISMSGAGIYDAAMMNNLETVGDAKISTTQSKFGGSSMAFDGTGDGLYRPSSDLFNFGTGNFTIEFWIYFNSKTGYQTIISFGYSPNTANGWVLQTGNGDGKILFARMTGSSSSVIASDTGATVNTGQWYHIAVVRNGSTTSIYRDGTSVSSGSDTNNYSCVANFYIGGGSSTAFDNYYFNGYIDDLRITKGVARYTTNFSVPTSALPIF
jgi:hypothetical protein